MTKIIQTISSRQHLQTGRLITEGIVAGGLAILANLLVYFLIPALFSFSLTIPMLGPGSTPQPLPLTMVIFVISIAAVGATILMMILDHFTPQPMTIFRIIAGLVLLLSFIAPLSLPVMLRIKLTLMSMHILTAVIITYMLTRETSAV